MQTEIITALDVSATFDAATEAEKRIGLLNHYLATSRLRPYVLGTSIWPLRGRTVPPPVCAGLPTFHALKPEICVRCILLSSGAAAIYMRGAQKERRSLQEILAHAVARHRLFQLVVVASKPNAGRCESDITPKRKRFRNRSSHR